ncbi:MAG: right-handed parallel beta-helix repeat-containing protein [Isosphaeraceae bacterium]|nr:right-handed parallel beta-helix repeat-containing protein [Isosphaeraceae bacterium]
MPLKNAACSRVSLDDDWLAAFDDEPQGPAVEPEPAKAEPAPRRRRPAVPVDADSDDWLNVMDESHGAAPPRAKTKRPQPARPDADHATDDEPADGRPSWRARLAGLRRRLMPPLAVGAAGLTVGLVVGITVCPAQPSPPKIPTSVQVPTDMASRELIVARNGGEGTHANLADAIRAAAPGQRIRVKAGTYSGAVVVDKPVEIIGDGNPSDVVIETEGGTGLLVKAETAVVRGLTVRVKAGKEKGHGVEVRTGRAVLEELEIEAPDAGLVVTGAGAEPIVRRVWVRGIPAHALVVAEKAGGYFEGCKFVFGTVSGVQVRDEARAVFRGCEVRAETGVGLVLRTKGQATLFDCRVRDCVKGGAVVTDGGRLRLFDCEVSGSSADGVLVGAESEANVEGGRVGNNAHAGIAVKGGGRIITHRCDLGDNKGGPIDAEPGCTVLTDVARSQPAPSPRPTGGAPAPLVPQTPGPTRAVSPPAPLPMTEPAPQVNQAAPLPEPAPDFDRYRNTSR